jgi:chromosome segregation ATPase
MYYKINLKGGIVMQEERNNTQSNEDVITNRSVRLAESTHKKMKELADARNKSLDEVQKELLALYDRVSLQDDSEFGSQIEQVNELLMRVGDRFSNIVSHANLKIENQEERFQKLKTETDEEIRGLKENVKELNLQFKEKEEKHNEIVEKEREARHDKWKLEDQLEKQQKESEERITELKDALTAKDEKIADKNEKIDSLEKQISEMKEDLSSIEDTRKEFESTIKESKLISDQQATQIQDLKRDIEALKEKQKAELEKKDFEKDKALLEAERKFQAKLSQVYEEHNRNIAELYERLRVKEEKIQKEEIKGQMNIDDFNK